nr:HNH endonuclease domain-containing protein [Natronogracilivirga saccharolytica]
MIALLHQAVDIPRDVGQVRRLLKRERAGGLRCVWSGREIRGDLNIDHALPYSLWQNNNLWNLLPVSAPVNSRKRDRIPTPGLIDRSAGRIREVWGLYAGNYGSQFYRELFEGLAVGRGGAAERARGTREPGGDVSGDFAVREAEGQSEIGRGDELDPAIGSLKQISAYLIDKRGFPEFDL